MKWLLGTILIINFMGYLTCGLCDGADEENIGAPPSSGLLREHDTAKEYLKYEEPVTSQSPNIFRAFLRMIITLLILLALFFIAVFFFKKLKLRRGFQSKGLISILFRTPLGSKESICLVEVAGEILVLGVTSNQISLLLKVENPEVSKNIMDAYTTSDSHFQSYLKTAQDNLNVEHVEHLNARSDDMFAQQSREPGSSRSTRNENRTEYPDSTRETAKTTTVLESLKTLRDGLKGLRG